MIYINISISYAVFISICEEIHAHDPLQTYTVHNFHSTRKVWDEDDVEDEDDEDNEHDNNEDTL